MPIANTAVAAPAYYHKIIPYLLSRLILPVGLLFVSTSAYSTFRCGASATSPFVSRFSNMKSAKVTTLKAGYDNPFQGIMRGLGLTKAPSPPDPSNIKDNSPCLEELKQRLRSMQTTEEAEAFALIESGRGPTNAKANLRLFDAPDGTQPRVTLYRDHAAWCPYCQKVWLQLEEKRIPYEVKKVPLSCYGDKPSWFLDVCPSGMLPVAKIDGQIITESNDIMSALEEKFPDYKPLIPKDKRDYVQRFLRLERQLFSVWFQWLRSPFDARMDFELILTDVEKALGMFTEGPYFLGEDISIVDIMFTPFLERMSASLPYFKGFDIRNSSRFPLVEAWFQAMESRPTYQNIKSDYYTHAHDLPPQIGGASSIPEASSYAEEIDGKTGSWNLPLPEGFEPVVGMATSDEAAKKEAAANLLQNFDAVVKFALRGIGSPGMPPVRAQLADPNANSDMRYKEQIECMLRFTVHALLEGHETVSSSKPSGLSGEEVAACIYYLRDRVGVPRDMSFPAARQLRAHLNWAVDVVQN